MLVAVADTHAVIWYIFDDARLSQGAKAFLDDAAGSGHQVGVSTITLAEIVYLSEKGRIHPATMTRLVASLDTPENVLVEVPFDRHIALALSRADVDEKYRKRLHRRVKPLFVAGDLHTCLIGSRILERPRGWEVGSGVD